MIDPETSQLCYFANVRFPSERANSIQIVRMCSAFGGCGVDVTLYHPLRYNRFARAKTSLTGFYGVSNRFDVKRLFSLDCIDLLPQRLQYPAFRLQSFSFGLRALFVMRGRPDAVFYIRDNATFAMAARFLPPGLRRNLFYEAHDFPAKPRSAALLTRAAAQCGGVVAITHGLKERFLSSGVPNERIHVAPDGVDPARFDRSMDRKTACERLNLPRDNPLAIYTGQYFPWKGVDTLVRAAAFLDEDWRVVLVGGREEDRRRLAAIAAEEKTTDRILFRERVGPGEVPVWLSAADVLVLPNSGRFPISSHYTSPMKLFEYMAAGRAIVASDLPSLREVLRHEENALLIPPDDPEALARAMGRLLTDRALDDRLSANAGKEASRYTWRARAEGILQFLRTVTGRPDADEAPSNREPPDKQPLNEAPSEAERSDEARPDE